VEFFIGSMSILDLDLSEKNIRNLQTLTRIDSEITEIVNNSSHIALYQFNAQDGKWSRYGVEGAGFIVQRKSEPYYKFIILNKLGKSGMNTFGITISLNVIFRLYLGLDNFILELGCLDKIKIQSPYIMIRYAAEVRLRLHWN
jgi:hypothetical protein